MKTITFQIDDTGKVLVFPQDLTGEMLPEEKLINSLSIQTADGGTINLQE